jgi:hypothetical protein
MVSGDYLANFGFVVGSKVIIDITHGQIIIRPVDVDETEKEVLKYVQD